MKTSIYISSLEIKLLTYKHTKTGIKIDEYHTMPLPEETVLGGVILYPTAVIECLKKLKLAYPNAFKDVSLTITGSFVYYKRIKIPSKLPKKMYLNLIKDEFADVTADVKNLICDYVTLDSGSADAITVQAFGIEHKYFMTYLDVFSAAGISLSSIFLGVKSLYEFFANEKSLKNQNYVLNAVNEEIMLSAIFHGNKIVFQQKSRLFADASGSTALSILNGLTGIIAFNGSQNFPKLTKSYYVGLNQEELNAIALMSDNPDIEFHAFNIYKNLSGEQKLPPDAFFIYLNALVPKKQKDLFHVIKQQKKAQKREKPKNPLVPISIVIVSILMLVVAFLLVRINYVEHETKMLQDFLDDPATVDARTEYADLNSEIARFNAIYSNAQGVTEEIENYPSIDKELLTTIVSASAPDIWITGLNFNSAAGILSVSGISPEMRDSSAFVYTLRQKELISDVYYTGYRVNTDGDFVFSIDVIKADWNTEAGDNNE